MNIAILAEEALLHGRAKLPDPGAEYIEASARAMVGSMGIGHYIVQGLRDTFTDGEQALAAARQLVLRRHVVPGEPITRSEQQYLEALAVASVKTHAIGRHGVEGLKNQFASRDLALGTARAVLETRHAAPSPVIPDQLD